MQAFKDKIEYKQIDERKRIHVAFQYNPRSYKYPFLNNTATNFSNFPLVMNRGFRITTKKTDVAKPTGYAANDTHKFIDELVALTRD